MSALTHRVFSLKEALRQARDTRAVEIGEGVLASVPRVFAEHFGARPAIIIADANTFAAAGDRVEAAFKSAGRRSLPPFVFRDPKLFAEHQFVEQLKTVLRGSDAVPVAVGSGTVNDLTKLAAHRVGRPYLCVATAASMDGYTAFGASITYEGSKQTFLCPAPTAVVADLDVIRGAPAVMAAWGYADLLAKVTAGADWILADALGIEPVQPLAWAIVQGRFRDLVAEPAKVKAGDPSALARLIEGLLLGGFAMQVTQSSRPASGSEHQFSHLWDMQRHVHHGCPPSHGFKVAIGTLAVTALYEYILAQPLEQLDVARCCAEWPGAEAWRERAGVLLGDGDVGRVAAGELLAKIVSPDQLAVQLGVLRSNWVDIRKKLSEQLIPSRTLRAMLSAVGAPTEPEHIGISRERLRRSFWQAFCIRRRFTVLDLAARAGLLDGALAGIFGTAGRA